MIYSGIDDQLVKQVRLLRPLEWYLRHDVLPFAVAYACLYALVMGLEGTGRGIAFLCIPACLVLHMSLFLVSQWSVSVRCSLGYQVVPDLARAAHVHVVATDNAGKDRIVPLDRCATLHQQQQQEEGGGGGDEVSLLGQTVHVQREFFEFQKVIYSFNADKRSVERLAYPTVASARNFLKWPGYTTPAARTAYRKWGLNEYDTPLPAFLDLYVEHLVAPFFVFQVLCLFLWSLDDYWYYSAFTLLMLMFFEGMLCKQRQASLQQLREMKRASVVLGVYRDGAWVGMLSEQLLPGDVVSIAMQPSAAAVAAARGGRSAGHDACPDDDVLPCDVLLLQGNCVVNEAILTGESVPQMKEALPSAENYDRATIDLEDGHAAAATWKRHLMLGGTRLLQCEHQGEVESCIPPPPNRGCVAIVVRTGFGTVQGNLMRKILFATERINATSAETVHFIAVLVFFAVIASATVMHGGLQDEARNKFKLILHCIMIVTSVVPPELPMELSLSVTNSLAALGKNLIYCTEPFRIPFAGKLDVLCFDKTGTLTKDEMILRGVVGAAAAPRTFGPSIAFAAKGSHEGQTGLGGDALAMALEVQAIVGDEPAGADGAAGSVPDAVMCVMAACNALHSGQREEVVGDPLEVAAFAASGFAPRASASSSGAAKAMGFSLLLHERRGIKMTVRHRFLFSSTLKRMSVVVSIDQTSASGPETNTWVLTKGAPEVLEERLAEVPPFYRRAYQHHMNNGKRVLALAGRRIPAAPSDLRAFPREEAERDLVFFAFLLFDSDLKADTKSVIKDLRLSNHKIVIITGDSAFTAANVGRRVGLVKKSAERSLLFLLPSCTTAATAAALAAPQLSWRPEETAGDDDDAAQAGGVPFAAGSTAQLEASNTLCVTGPAMHVLQSQAPDLQAYRATLRQVAPFVTLFARVSPAQKEDIVLALNDAGHFTLMCGDGTNDVGALKAAHVGVSIINDVKFEGLIDSSAALAPAAAKGEKKPKGSSQKDRLSRALKELEKQEEDPTLVKLGDASIASPFTARRTSIDSVLTVLRQGRCTLVTTIQVFKILALNCLVSAYMMSVLYLRGLKQGDMQMTASGLVTAGLFFFLSQAKPVSRLAPCKPPSSVFARSIAVSIAGQFVVHLACLVATLVLCETYMSADDSTLTADGKFQPNVINSAMFLLSAVMQVNNFVINYRGHPFTQSIQENATLWRSVQAIYVSLLVVAGGQFEPLNDFLQMAPFPSSHFQGLLLLILLLNFGLNYGIELASRRLE